MKKKDKVQIGPEIRPGVRIGVRSDGTDERLVELHDHDEGKPIGPSQEYVLCGRPDADGWRDVTVLHGPAQVATPAYREGYDRIFGKKAPVGEA